MKTDPVFIVITLNDSWNYMCSTQPVTRLLQKKRKIGSQFSFPAPILNWVQSLDFTQFKVEMRVIAGQGGRDWRLEIITR